MATARAPRTRAVAATVFAAAPGGGNPCRVVLDAAGLGDAELQDIARAFGQETVAVLPPMYAGSDAHLRFFAPASEMTLCVHGAIAAAAVLGARTTRASLVFDTASGPVLARRIHDDDRVELRLPAPESHGVAISAAVIAQALGIAAAEIASDGAPILWASVGRPKLLVPLTDWRALDRISRRHDAFASLCVASSVTGIYAYTLRTRRADANVDARQFPYGAGFDEDPASGVAAAALAGALAALSPDQHDSLRITIDQGFALGRPSRLEGEAHLRNGSVFATSVIGRADLEAG